MEVSAFLCFFLEHKPEQFWLHQQCFLSGGSVRGTLMCSQNHCPSLVLVVDNLIKNMSLPCSFLCTAFLCLFQLEQQQRPAGFICCLLTFSLSEVHPYFTPQFSLCQPQTDLRKGSITWKFPFIPTLAMHLKTLNFDIYFSF